MTKANYRVQDIEWSANYGEGLRGVNMSGEDNFEYPKKQTARVWHDCPDDTQIVLIHDFETLFRKHPTFRKNVAKYGHSTPTTLDYLTALREAPAMQFVRDLLQEYGLEIG